MDLNVELLKAAEKGDMEAVELLIKKGANVNTKINFGRTPLIGAAGEGHTETVKLLIQKGAEVTAKNNYGETALIGAAHNGHTETAELLIQKGADIDAKNNSGLTALMHATGKGHTETVELLIREEADVNARNNDGGTALTYAVIFRQTKTIKLLIKNGANVVYAYGHPIAKTIIIKLREEKPEIFTEKQRVMIDLYSNPEKIPHDKRKEVIKLLREFQKKGSITKEKSLKLFTNLQKIWNKKIDIKSKEMRKPREKPNGNNLKKINRVM
ncbi:ankyrin repeat domain-containing protein [Candidatus Micrarchaeota archaeon]|nr:ankyrin repeat domain-containing protein [Candidatus Micrarchaeota archaeon]